MLGHEPFAKRRVNSTAQAQAVLTQILLGAVDFPGEHIRFHQICSVEDILRRL